MNELIENYVRYYKQYETELNQIYGTNWLNIFENMEQILHDLPITHSTNIIYIDSVLSQGLLPFSRRKETNYSKSAIYDYDKLYGLDHYVFAKIGTCPPYGPEKGRITILLDDTVCEQNQSFFTFHDLTAIMLFNPEPNNSFVKRMIQQFPQEKLPLAKIYSILAMTFIKSNKNIYSFINDNLSTFPAAYDPDFLHCNSGDPEIKISGGVVPEKFIGFLVREEQVKQELIKRGVAEAKIVVSMDRNNDRQLLVNLKKESQILKSSKKM